MAALPNLSKGIGSLQSGLRIGQRGRPLTVPRGRSGLHKGTPGGGIIQTIPRPGLHKGTLGSGIIQTIPRAPGATPQNPGGTPQAPGAPPQSGTGGSGSSPLDSTYFANVAANQLRVGNQVNALNLQGSQNQTALQQALAQLAYQQPRQQLALEQRANATGGLYSSAEDQNQGDLAHQFAMRQTAAQQNESNQMSRIAAQIAALRGGEGLYESQQAADAATRASNAAANNPVAGVTLPSAAPPRSSRPTPARPGQVIRSTTRFGGGPRPTLAQAIAKRPVVQIRPTFGKGRPRGLLRG